MPLKGPIGKAIGLISFTRAKRGFQKPAKPGPATSSWTVCETVVGETLKEAADGDSAFQASQTQACTLVNTKPKCQMAVVGAFELQRIRVFKLRGIAVGRPDAQCDQGACWQRNTTDLARLDSSTVA